MPQLHELVHFKAGELDPRSVSLDSPIEDQVRVVFEAARRYAQLHGFEPFFLKGRHGLKGPMVMKQLLRDLFLTTSTSVDTAEFDRIAGIIPQALKRTGAAVCLFNPERSTPTYFVANELPADIVPVVLNIRNKSAGASGSRGFNEDAFLNTTERRLSASEAGETQPPGEVKVTTAASSQLASTGRPLSAANLAQIEKSRKFRERVLEEITTNPVPLTARDITVLIAADGFEYSVSTVRDVLIELVQAGKVVGRKETKEEALLRGGGKTPISHRPLLYVAAPGPVPTRTQLPAGVKADATTIDVLRGNRRAAKKTTTGAPTPALATAGFDEPSTAPTDLDALVATVGVAVNRLLDAAKAPKVDAGAAEEAATLRARVAELEASLAEKNAALDKANGQVTALRAAIASLA